MNMKNKILSYFIALFVFLTLNQLVYGANNDISFELQPNLINIGTFYNGTTLKVKGKVPLGAKAVLRVSGHYSELHLKKKGKIAGLLWMNIGDVTVGNVPEVFLVITSKDMSKKLDDPNINLGYKYLEKMMTLEPKGEDKTFIFKELVKLLEESGTYGIYFDKLKYTGDHDNYRTFEATIPIPPKMKQGVYKVELFAVNDSQVVGKTDRELTLKQVGFPALVSKLAFEYPLIYGIGAVIIAILAGLLMGILFKGKGGAH